MLASVVYLGDNVKDPDGPPPCKPLPELTADILASHTLSPLK